MTGLQAQLWSARVSPESANFVCTLVWRCLALFDLIQPVRYNLANHIRYGISLSSLPCRDPSRRYARQRAITDFTSN